MNRDFGLEGAGKGDADRTSNVKKFQENLAEIPFNPQDKTGFKKVGPGRFKKTYGKPANYKIDATPTPTPESLMPAARAMRGAIGGSTEH